MTTITQAELAQVEVNAARIVVAAAANWEAAHSQSLVEFVDSRIESTTLDGLGTLLPVISEIRRCGWISEDQTRPTTPDERLLTFVSVANLVIEARRMAARADGPFYFVDGKWVGLKTLCICERIKVARQTRGLTLQDVGDVLGIDGRHVHAWEAGRRNPGPKHLAKLAEVLGLQVTDLLPQPNHNRPASSGHRRSR